MHKFALLSINVAHAANDIYAHFMPTIMPVIIRRFGMSLTLAGFYAALMPLLSSFLQPVFGLLSDKIRSRIFIILGPFLSGLFMSLIAFITAPWQLLPLLICAAIGTAAFHPQAAGLTGMLTAQDQEHSSNIAYFTVAGATGAAFSALLACSLIGEEQDLTKLIYSLPFGLAGSILCYFFVPSFKNTTKPLKALRWSLVKVKLPTLLQIISIVIFRSVVIVALTSFMPELFYQFAESGQESNAFAFEARFFEHSNKLIIGALGITVFGIANAISSVFGSKISKKLSDLPTMVLSFVISIPLLWLFFETHSLTILLFLGLVINFSQALTISLSQKLFPDRAATASSMTMGFGWGFAILLMPLVGFFGDMFGLDNALKYTSLSFLLLATVTCFTLKSALSSQRLFKSMVAVFVLFLTFGSAQAADTIHIQSVQMQNNTLSLKHSSYGDIGFKKRLYNIPPRLTFDLVNAKLDTGAQNFRTPNPSIKEIRVAQFDPTTVRVVVEAVDISTLEKIKVTNVGQSIYFQLGLKDVEILKHEFEDGNLTIYADAPITTRKIELNSPERLVVDLIGAKLGNQSLKTSFANGEEQIKIAQFESSIARIVFTGEDAHDREIAISEDQTVLVIKGKGQKSEEIKPKLRDKIYSLRLLEKGKDESVFVIKSTKELDYKYLTLHNPERLVIDLFGIAFEEELISTQFEKTPHVSDVRFGLASLGKPVTRVVFDLTSNALLTEFKELNDQKELIVKILGDPDDELDDIPQAKLSVGRSVVLDPGHGGYDPGAMYGNHQEKDITLSISIQIKKYLDKAGIKTYLSRTEDRFISLAERVEISNSIYPDLFVSVHVNALATNPNMDGLQTYYYSNTGYKIAQVLHRNLLKEVGMPDRNVRKARFWVCKYTAAPSVLLELGFMTNVKERKKLVTKSYQNELARATAQGIIEYLESQGKR